MNEQVFDPPPENSDDRWVVECNVAEGPVHRSRPFPSRADAETAARAALAVDKTLIVVIRRLVVCSGGWLG